jgi:hypothetical protein
MKVGDLVTHIVHHGAVGMIVGWNDVLGEAKVLWTNNSWGTKWELTQHVEVIDEDR